MGGTVHASNDPQVLTALVNRIGIKDGFAFTELFSYDEDSGVFDFVPRQAVALLFLYPWSEIKIEGASETEGPWYTKQTVPGLCGTIAVLHALLNNIGLFRVDPGSWLAKFAAASMGKAPNERAIMLQEAKELLAAHESLATDDTTPVMEDYDGHFVTIINFNGRVVELDGLKARPVDHGDCVDLLRDAVRVVQNKYLPHIKNPDYTSATVLSAIV